jgi:hypothetical protein
MRVRPLLMSFAVAATLAACGSGSKTATTTTGATPISDGGTAPAASGAGAFCAANNALSDALPADADPEQIQAVWDEAQPLFQKVVDTAPAELHDDVVVVIAAYQQLLQTTVSAVPDASVPADVQAASGRIDAYITANCGSE